MDVETFRKQLGTAYRTMRTYTYHILEDLQPDETQWRPDNTQARTIQSYARHLVNTEIYWLKALDNAKFNYLMSEASVQESLSLYRSLEAHYLNLLSKALPDDLKIKATIYDKEAPHRLVKQGTLAWTMLRITLHAFGHASHINHIRYSLNNPPASGETHWWAITENLIELCNFIG